MVYFTIDVPRPIETQRLLLNRMRQDDFVQMKAIYSDADAMRLYDRAVCTTRAQVIDIFDRIDQKMEAGTAVNYAMRLLDEPESFLGRVAWHGHVDHMAWVSYELLPQYRGKGYSLEAMRALIEEAQRQGLEVLMAEVHPENKNSIALLDKLGFEFAQNAKKKPFLEYRLELNN